MRNVTTAYHNANKANTRSSDFLIVADTGFNLDQIKSISGWKYKTTTDAVNAINKLTMYRCNKKASLSTTDYGYIIIGGSSENEYFSTVNNGTGVTFLFENDCYPVEYNIEFFSDDILTPVITATGWTNDRPLMHLSWMTLLNEAGWKVSNLCRLKFSFTKWSKQDVYPVILFATYGKPSAVFTKDDLLSVNIVNETDITSRTIPYHSYACTIIDETDAYNPLIKNSKIYDLSSGQKFRFFNFEKGFTDDEAIPDELSLFDHEICPMGTAYFRNAKQHGTAVNFDFMDIIEKYDRIYLSDYEVSFSSHFTPTEVRSYLRTLFGNDLDISSIDSDLKMIMPFYKESKMQILLYIAQILKKYISVTSAGVLTLKSRSETWDENSFLIELAQSYQNPVIEKNFDSSAIEVNMNTYSVSQNSELAINSIKFIYVNENKEEKIIAYSDSEMKNIYNAETGESISSLPKDNVIRYKIHYALNDIYKADSLFSMFGNDKLPISEFKNRLFSDFNFLETVQMSDGREITYLIFLSYYDTYVELDFWFSEEIKITDTDNNFYKVINNCTAAILAMGNLQGSKITSSTNVVRSQKNSSLTPAVTISNPAIANFETARKVCDWISSQIDNSAFSIETDWRGDCALELGDDAIAEVSLVQNGVKTYTNRYIGTVVKNIIEYNGALRMQTTLYAPTQNSLS